jgi:hypothetical protein
MTDRLFIDEPMGVARVARDIADGGPGTRGTGRRP